MGILKRTKRINNEVVIIDGHIMFKKADGLYGGVENREDISLMTKLNDFLILENMTSQGRFYDFVNKILISCKIKGRLCLEH
jgi:hypothetical protein